MGHAITPTASKGLSASERRAAVLGAHESKPQLMDLALSIADSYSRSDIETYCVPVVTDKVEWYDTSALIEPLNRHPEDRDFIDTALAYLDERGTDAGYRTVRHQLYPHLVRFEVMS